ncbi:ABC transporter ATP-binding protein [Metabacillus sp. RGM 3146]|uniref:ABC transporter ATP-binding protein n=1 Tax=Metabacillus sp. RGM 3146 TaxID=3401092 RepID=UPI003B9A4A2C
MFEISSLVYKNILDIKSLTIKKHLITSLIGESGAGKSTLLKMFNVMLSPDKGFVYYKGKDLKECSAVEHRRKVVMLAQQPVIFEGTVYENLMIGRSFSEKEPVSEKKAREAMDLVLLRKSFDQDADELSGGEKQRLALARVYLMDPEVLLLDEPTSSLDKETENEVMKRFFEAMKKDSKTIIMVTHSPEIAEKYSDEIIRIENINKGVAYEGENG